MFAFVFCGVGALAEHLLFAAKWKNRCKHWCIGKHRTLSQLFCSVYVYEVLNCLVWNTGIQGIARLSSSANSGDFLMLCNRLRPSTPYYPYYKYVLTPHGLPAVVV